jgi:enoyl-CoA hydratase
MAATGFDTLRYELLDDGSIARVTMSRPEVRNAQNRLMTYELDEAFRTAAADPTVKVLILAGDGPHFSSGHDLSDPKTYAPPPVNLVAGLGKDGIEGYMAGEEEVYIGMCRRWRDLAKPTIAQVQGRTIAGGLMLMWVCDIIVASDDATFCDPTVAFGVNGVEWFCHPWELGPRKAKELLFTGDVLTAAEAATLGMVNRVVPRAALEDETLALARRIATKPSFALKLAKQSVNQAVDAQGFAAAQQAAFSLHHLAHAARPETVGGMRPDPRGGDGKPR